MEETAARLNAALAGRYRIERRLGQGGMATVYLAEDLRHRRRVAIKVLTPEIGAAIGHERFLREIEISAGLRHPHILPLFDSGEARVPSTPHVPPLRATERGPGGEDRTAERGPGGEARTAERGTGGEDPATESATRGESFLFYVMPYVEGASLRDRLNREQQLPFDEAIAIADEVADALGYAHERGVIHRDVKPENILLEGGHAVVADFGIARAISAAGGERITQTGMAIGTPAYMSPEQALGSTDLDGRSDIYALGCVLYEMLAGDPPFIGTTPRAVIARHTIDPPPRLRTVRDTVPPGLEATIMKALAKVPADRFVDAGALRRALAQPGGGVATAPAEAGGGGLPPRARSRPLSVGAATIVLLLAVAAVVRLAWREPATLDANRVMVFPLVAPDDSQRSHTIGEDVATIIGNALDGVGPLHWVDGWAELDAARREDVRGLSIEDARALARARNCRWFVTGRLVVRGDSTEVSLALYDVDGDVSIASGSATGDADAWRTGLRALNDLLPALIPGGAPDPATQWKDRSPAALGSFLLGEAAFRRIAIVEAWGHYRRAVELDSGFALAALRGAQAASWAHQPDEAAALVRTALRQPLSARDAAFARGLAYYLDGNADSAIASFRAAVLRDPEMSVAWMQIGETYTHLLPRAGSPVGPAEEAFLEARRLDPRAPASTTHLIEIWLRRGDAGRAAPLVAQLRAAGSTDTALLAKIAIMNECATTGPERMAWDDIARTRPFPLLAAATEFGASSLACTTAAARALLRVDTSRTDEAESRRFFAQMASFNVLLARGRASEAIAQVDSHVARWGSGTSLYLLAGPVYAAAAHRARETAAGDAERFGADFHNLPYSQRLWALGVWEAHGGSADVAADVADELERRANARDGSRERVMAMSVRAHVALARGDTTKALEGFDALIPANASTDELKWDEALPLGTERLALARILVARGAYARAIEIADVFDSAWPVIYPLYLVPSLEIRADAAARLGERETESKFRERLRVLAGGDGN